MESGIDSPFMTHTFRAVGSRLPSLVSDREKSMRVLSRGSCIIGLVAALALSVTAADAHRAHRAQTTQFGGAHDSVSAPQDTNSRGPGSIFYDPMGAPYPSGHGGNSTSPDFQMMK